MKLAIIELGVQALRYLAPDAGEDLLTLHLKQLPCEGPQWEERKSGVVPVSVNPLLCELWVKMADLPVVSIPPGCNRLFIRRVLPDRPKMIGPDSRPYRPQIQHGVDLSKPLFWPFELLMLTTMTVKALGHSIYLPLGSIRQGKILQVAFGLDSRLGTRAGFRRNVQMLSLDPRYVVAFAGNGVLERLVIQAKECGVQVVERRAPLGTSPKHSATIAAGAT